MPRESCDTARTIGRIILGAARQGHGAVVSVTDDDHLLIDIEDGRYSLVRIDTTQCVCFHEGRRANARTA